MKPLLSVICSVGCLFLVGCGSGGPELGEVSGQVTMDDQPVPNAVVTFTPVDGGRPSTGATDENGNYTLAFGKQPGALVGTHKVSVTSMSTAGETMDPNMSSDSDAYAKQAMGGSASDYDNATVEESIPAKYNTETILEYEVESGSNTINIELESE